MLDGNSVPDPTSPHLVLWNTEAFYRLRQELTPTYLRIDSLDDGDRLVGSFVGSRDGTTITAGASAPYGGLDLSRDRESAVAVMAAMQEFVDRLTAAGVL